MPFRISQPNTGTIYVPYIGYSIQPRGLFAELGYPTVTHLNRVSILYGFFICLLPLQQKNDHKEQH